MPAKQKKLSKDGSSAAISKSGKKPSKGESSTATSKSSRKRPEYARIEDITGKLSNTLDVIEDFIISQENHTTSDIMTRAEYARLVAERAKQLEEGCAPFIDPAEYGFDNVIQIAEKEVEMGLSPFFIMRSISNRNIYEIVDPNKLN